MRDTAIISGDNIKYANARIDFLKEDKNKNGVINIRTKTNNIEVIIMSTGEIRVYGSSSNITCATCSYFQHGKCKRIAPEMIVDSSDWCGEHPDFLVEYDPQPWIIGNKDIVVNKLSITFDDGVKLAYEILTELYKEYQVSLDFKDVKITAVFLTGLYKTLLKKYTIDKLDKVLIYKNMPKYIEDTKKLVIQHITEYKDNPEQVKIVNEIISRIIKE